MKKIAVLRCLRVSASCTGSGCLRALNEKTGAFERYGDETLQGLLPFLPATAAAKINCLTRKALTKKLNAL